MAALRQVVNEEKDEDLMGYARQVLAKDQNVLQFRTASSRGNMEMSLTGSVSNAPATPRKAKGSRLAKKELDHIVCEALAAFREQCLGVTLNEMLAYIDSNYKPSPSDMSRLRMQVRGIVKKLRERGKVDKLPARFKLSQF